MSSSDAVLFDLGNTVAAYYRASEFEPVLVRCVQAALAELQHRGIKSPARRRRAWHGVAAWIDWTAHLEVRMKRVAGIAAAQSIAMLVAVFGVVAMEAGA